MSCQEIIASPHGPNQTSITNIVNTGYMDGSDVQKQIDNTIKGLSCLIKQIDYLQLNEYWEPEINHILNLAEELDNRREIIASKMETLSNGDNSND